MPTASLNAASFSEARSRLPKLLDSAAVGAVPTLRRGERTYALVEASLLREFLMREVPANAQVIVDPQEMNIFIPDTPISGDGSDLDAALEDTVTALREYAEDWLARLRLAKNHERNWPLVTLISLSSDEELISWLATDASPPGAA